MPRPLVLLGSIILYLISLDSMRTSREAGYIMAQSANYERLD
jgi:hypothetical protein